MTLLSTTDAGVTITVKKGEFCTFPPQDGSWSVAEFFRGEKLVKTKIQYDEKANGWFDLNNHRVNIFGVKWIKHTPANIDEGAKTPVESNKVEEPRQMRFTVGENYFFIRTKFDNCGNPNWGGLYVPWEHDKLEIEIIQLRCAEHHRVPVDWNDSDRRVDGFIFVDVNYNATEDSVCWYNQYPTACYGQIDDSNDRVIWRHPSNEDTFFKPFWRLENFVENIYEDIHPRLNRKCPFTSVQLKLLQEYMDSIEAKLKKEFNTKFNWVPFTYTNTKTGEVISPKGFMDCKLIPA